MSCIFLYLSEKGYKNIAIYGFGNLGKCLYREIKASTIKIKCIIDQYSKQELKDIKIIMPESMQESVDCIVNTTMYSNDEIGSILDFDYKMESLIEIIESTYQSR